MPMKAQLIKYLRRIACGQARQRSLFTCLSEAPIGTERGPKIVMSKDRLLLPSLRPINLTKRRDANY